MSLRRVVNGFLLWSALTFVAAAAWASEYHGQVVFGGLPVPGSTVTVTATQGDKKVVTVSDDQGVFSFTDLADGKWNLTIEMTGFAPLKQEITVAANAPAGSFELKLLSLDQIRAEDKPVKIDATAVATAAAPSAPSAATTAAAAADGKPAAPAGKKGAAAPAKGGPQVAAGGAPEAPAPQQDATSAQANDGFLINGSVNNAATSQYSMNQAFGNNRNGSRNLYNGNAFLRLDTSALDAEQYSLSGTPVPQNYNNFTAGFNFGGPINIPHLMPRGPGFNINYSRTQNSSVNAADATIPTGLIAAGQPYAGGWNLTSKAVTLIAVPTDLQTVNNSCYQALIADPNSGVTAVGVAAGTAVFANNIIPQYCISQQAATLLTLYPQQTNLNGDPRGYNYQLPLAVSSHSDTANMNIYRQFGNKNNLNGNFYFGSSRSSNPNIVGFLDKSNSISVGSNVNWNHRFTQRFSGNLSYSFSRQRSQLVPFFANRNNIESTANIAGASTDPRYWGPPSLGFSISGITGLNDGTTSYNRPETNSIGTKFYWNKFRHNIQFGADFSRREYNYLTQTNPDGSFDFTGAATQSSAGAGGSDFADFLLGLPDTSNIAYGNADKYLRQSVYDAFITDDFRVNPEFSITAGLRWEYGAPVTELKNRLVNLDVTPGFTQEAQVVAGTPTGPLTGMAYPTSLVYPDYSRPEPRLGVAWRPISGSSLLIRSGYDVTNDTSVYQSAAYAMATEAPLATTLSISNSLNCPFNMGSPFQLQTAACSSTTPNSFAIDPHFKVGYVQTWNLSVQRDLPYSMQAVVTYLGTKGTRGVQQILPNSCPPKINSTDAPCTTAVSGYRYRMSNGNLAREAGSVELRRRLRNGFTARLLYTFSKSLDDDYSLSGQGSISSGSTAQDWQHPEAERALSNTDQRHSLTFTAQYTTGMGLGGKALMSGWRGAIYKEWTVQTAITAGSGLPETVICTTCTETGTGIVGSVRPNVAAASPYAGAPAGFRINAAAFSAPVGTFGNLRRNSIEGPDQFTMNAVMNRTFRLHDRYSLDAQLSANNVLNHVVFSGWNTGWAANSPTFGAPSGANGMRSISLQFRLRF